MLHFIGFRKNFYRTDHTFTIDLNRCVKRSCSRKAATIAIKACVLNVVILIYRILGFASSFLISNQLNNILIY